MKFSCRLLTHLKTLKTVTLGAEDKCYYLMLTLQKIEKKTF